MIRVKKPEERNGTARLRAEVSRLKAEVRKAARRENDLARQVRQAEGEREQERVRADALNEIVLQMAAARGKSRGEG